MFQNQYLPPPGWYVLVHCPLYLQSTTSVSSRLGQGHQGPSRRLLLAPGSAPEGDEDEKTNGDIPKGFTFWIMTTMALLPVTSQCVKWVFPCISHVPLIPPKLPTCPQ